MHRAHRNGGTDRARIDVEKKPLWKMTSPTDWMQAERPGESKPNGSLRRRVTAAARRPSNAHVHIIYVRVVAADPSQLCQELLQVLMKTMLQDSSERAHIPQWQQVNREIKIGPGSPPNALTEVVAVSPVAL